MCAPKYFSNLDLKLKIFDTVALELFVGLIIHFDGWSRQLVHTYHDYSCCLHIKPFFLPNISTTPSIFPVILHPREIHCQIDGKGNDSTEVMYIISSWFHY